MSIPFFPGDYKSLPPRAVYLGSEDCPGQISEGLSDALDSAVEPVFIREDGAKHFFDLGM